MGGSKEKIIAGLRFHIKDKDVHIHDDEKKLKFILEIILFNREMRESLKALEEESDGVIEISGEEDTLCLLKRNDTITLFLVDDENIEDEIKEFLDGI